MVLPGLYVCEAAPTETRDMAFTGLAGFDQHKINKQSRALKAPLLRNGLAGSFWRITVLAHMHRLPRTTSRVVDSTLRERVKERFSMCSLIEVHQSFRLAMYRTQHRTKEHNAVILRTRTNLQLPRDSIRIPQTARRYLKDNILHSSDSIID